MKGEIDFRPVTVYAGLSFPIRLASLDALQRFLDDWPPSRRGSSHAHARAACAGARRGEVAAAAARTAFVGFAREAGILAGGRLPSHRAIAGRHAAARVLPTSGN